MLREELQAIDPAKLQEIQSSPALADLSQAADLASADSRLHEEYPTIVEFIDDVRKKAEAQGLSEREVALLTGGMALQLAILQSYTDTEPKDWRPRKPLYSRAHLA